MSVRQAAGALELQASGAVVVHAASRILAALIRNGRLTEGNHTALVRFAVRTALDLALETDRMVQSEDETVSPEALVSASAEATPSAGAAAGSSFGDDILDLLD
jgi:hypothetical protein